MGTVHRVEKERPAKAGFLLVWLEELGAIMLHDFTPFDYLGILFSSGGNSKKVKGGTGPNASVTPPDGLGLEHEVSRRVERTAITLKKIGIAVSHVVLRPRPYIF